MFWLKLFATHLRFRVWYPNDLVIIQRNIGQLWRSTATTIGVHTIDWDRTSHKSIVILLSVD